MPNLLSALNTAAGALRAFQSALDVTQNNVSNSQTPGYVKQIPNLSALSFQPDRGLEGGVQAGTPQTSRNEYAEIAVRQQVSLHGASSQLASTLDPIEQVFSVSDKNSISSTIDSLFQSFSSWSTNPDEGSVRSSVLNAAAQLANVFQQSASRLGKIRDSVDRDLRTTIDSINQIASQIQKFNDTPRGASGTDAGTDTQVNAALERLSELADVQVLKADDGTLTVLLGGQIPLVTASNVHPLSLQATSAGQSVVDENGTDVTQKITDGQLGALLSVRNDVFPHLIGGPSQPGELNVLASQLADSINDVFTAASGQPLFTYDSANPDNAAASLRVKDGLQASDLVAADPGPPPVSNGVPIKLSRLADGTLPGLQGMTFGEYYGSTASWIGNQLSQAQTASDAQAQTLSQARDLRQQLSGVNLNEEATRLMELQRSFQAASRMITVLDGLTQSIIDMVR